MDDDDLTVFSWNLEKKSFKGLTSNRGNVPLVVKSITDVVNAGPRGADAPFVGFLLEITGAETNVRKLCDTIERECNKKPGERISVTSQTTGGSAHTRESIIVMSRGARVAASTFEVQEGITPFIDRDKETAARKFGAAKLQNDRRFRARGNHPYAAKEEHHRKVNREPEWFRNGTLAEVEYGGRKLRIASVHAPGPDLSDKVDEVVNSIVNSAARQDVDILIGDLNRRGSMPATHFEDMSRDWTTGTTLGRKERDKLGKHRWDRVLAKRERPFDIESPQPVAVIRPVDLGKRLTDHAMVFAKVKPRATPTRPDETDPFSLQTPAPGPGGADLHSLEASKAMVQPADPTLLYSAASDRKSTSEKLQKQLEDNPLTSPSTEPASDPLSPPSATSPLTEPPPTTGTDSAMEESAEAMEAMAAEGEEIAEVAELVLL